jgi:hypothetical protein
MPVDGQPYDGGYLRQAEDGSWVVIKRDSNGNEYNDVAAAHRFAAESASANTATQAVRTIAAEITKKVARELPGYTRKPATVLSVDKQGAQQYQTVSVQIDGDSPSNPTAAVSLIKDVTPGARVYVEFVPPHGVQVIGSVSNDCVPDEMTFTAFGTVAASTSPPWMPQADFTSIEVAIAANTPGTTDTSITINVGGDPQCSITYGSGTGTQIETANMGWAIPANTPITVDIDPGTGLADCTITIRYCPGAGTYVAPPPPA